eukprot:6212489-Pleurochrysis_carterae.AAC.1
MRQAWHTLVPWILTGLASEVSIRPASAAFNTSCVFDRLFDTTAGTCLCCSIPIKSDLLPCSPPAAPVVISTSSSCCAMSSSIAAARSSVAACTVHKRDMAPDFPGLCAARLSAAVAPPIQSLFIASSMSKSNNCGHSYDVPSTAIGSCGVIWDILCSHLRMHIAHATNIIRRRAIPHVGSTVYRKIFPRTANHARNGTVLSSFEMGADASCEVSKEYGTSRIGRRRTARRAAGHAAQCVRLCAYVC